MKSVFSKKTAAIFLALVLALSMFSGCSQQAEVPALEEVVDAAVKAALEATVVPTNVTFEVDGKKITVEDVANVSIEDLLDQADITLNDGDYLTVAPTQTLSGNITIQVVRILSVTVVVAAEDPADELRYTAQLSDGTVADALAAAGVELAENQTVDTDLEKALENGMVITVTTEAPEETVPEETTPPETKPKETTPPETKPKETKPKKTVVSVEYYEDCDGSGHGVKVITYSDGSQEEVPY